MANEAASQGQRDGTTPNLRDPPRRDRAFQYPFAAAPFVWEQFRLELAARQAAGWKRVSNCFSDIQRVRQASGCLIRASMMVVELSTAKIAWRAKQPSAQLSWTTKRLHERDSAAAQTRAGFHPRGECPMATAWKRSSENAGPCFPGRPNAAAERLEVCRAVTAAGVPLPLVIFVTAMNLRAQCV